MSDEEKTPQTGNNVTSQVVIIIYNDVFHFVS